MPASLPTPGTLTPPPQLSSVSRASLREVKVRALSFPKPSLICCLSILARVPDCLARGRFEISSCWFTRIRRFVCCYLLAYQLARFFLPFVVQSCLRWKGLLTIGIWCFSCMDGLIPILLLNCKELLYFEICIVQS